MTSRHKLLATIVVSYAIACLAIAGCLELVTARYETAVEIAEDQQLNGILNREVEDLAWNRYAEVVRNLSRDVSQEPELRRLVAAGDIAALQAALPDTWRRSAVTSGDVVVFGVAVLRPDGTALATEGEVAQGSADADIGSTVARRRGMDRLTVLTRVGTSHGHPVLTVVHPIGGLRPVGYLAVDADPLRALAGLDERMGIGLTFWSLDGRQLAAPDTSKAESDAQLHEAAIAIASPGGAPVMTVRTSRNVADRVVTMRDIRMSSFLSLIGLLIAVAAISTAVVLSLTRRIAIDEANERSKDAVRAKNVQLDAALNNIVQGVAMFDAEDRLVLCNARYLQIYGHEPEEVSPGMTLRQIMERRIANGQMSRQAADDMFDAARHGRSDGDFGHFHSHLADGRCIAITVRPMSDGGKVTTHQDITEQRRSEARIAHIARHDALTGLPNRVLLNEQLEAALGRTRRGEVVAVHVLDLDNFKSVNDTLGHPIGDKLLTMVADRLRGQVRESDTIARLGGDEFAVVEQQISRPADAIPLARRIIEVVSQPYEIDGHQVVIGTSIGIAVGPQDGTTPDQIMRNADLALYRAKADGRGTFHFFEPAMDAMMQARRVLERDLRKALADGEFELHYQPMFNLAEHEISGFEALLRWRHPEKGMIQPNAFIPLAEDTRLIVPLGEWVIREACATAATWPSHLKIAVNLSVAQFRSPDLVQVVVDALATSGLAADRLELEITESILLEGTERTLAMLHQLRALGIRIAMDDFGTVYSSLSYLQSFPFDKIKIDKSFVKEIVDSAGSRNIVRAVAALASGLGIAATAEGVETDAQLDIIRSEGCTEMQGFLLSRPLKAGDIRQLLLSETTMQRAKGSDLAA
jgi:diguanylate cyclase (GGDEF)-like protein